MPYNLKDFPIETSEPKIEVTLPPGRHTFELIVEDSAGLKSLPDTVIVVVNKQAVPPPAISAIQPGFGVRGKPQKATIYGENLIGPYEVKMLRSGQAAADVQAEILAGGTAEALPVSIFAEANASLGPYDVQVTARGGTVTNTAGLFKVVDKPVIREFKPTSSDRGEETRFVIKGENLHIDGTPWTEHPVEFLVQGQPDPHITAKVREVGSTSEELVVIVTVKPAATPGDRTVRVTTPAGSGDSPAAMIFRINAPR
jgi:hypothetical protein